MTRRLGTIAPPALLALLELFHPHVHDILDVPLPLWLVIHYGQMVLFPLTALSLILLVHDLRGLSAALTRVAAFAFGVLFVAFDTAAGIVTGEMVAAARVAHAEAAWRPAIAAVWAHPIIGGVGTPALAVAGTAAWIIATTQAAIALKRAGRPWVPSLVVAASCLGLLVFKSHAWPGGPLSFGTLAAGALLLEVARRRGRQNDRPRPVTT